MERLIRSNPNMEKPLPELVRINAVAVKKHRGLVQSDVKGLGGAGAHRAITENKDVPPHNMTLNSLQTLAKSLDVPAWHLLLASYNPADPPDAVTKAQYQAELKRRMLDLAARYRGDSEPDEETPARPVPPEPDNPGGTPRIKSQDGRGRHSKGKK